jgi:hypothetical protein
VQNIEKPLQPLWFIDLIANTNIPCEKAGHVPIRHKPCLFFGFQTPKALFSLIKSEKFFTLIRKLISHIYEKNFFFCNSSATKTRRHEDYNIILFRPRKSGFFIARNPFSSLVLLENWTSGRSRFRVPGSAFRVNRFCDFFPISLISMG